MAASANPPQGASSVGRGCRGVRGHTGCGGLLATGSSRFWHAPGAAENALQLHADEWPSLSDVRDDDVILESRSRATFGGVPRPAGRLHPLSCDDRDNGLFAVCRGDGLDDLGELGSDRLAPDAGVRAVVDRGLDVQAGPWAFDRCVAGEVSGTTRRRSIPRMADKGCVE